MGNLKITELVIKAQSGDQNALNDLLAECYNDIYFYVLKTVKDEELAADVTQESFLDIMSSLGKLQEPGAFPSWARRIAYCKCALHFRNAKEVLLEEDEDGETILDRLPDESDEALPDKIAEDKELCETVREMINELPPEQSSALLLYYYEARSVKDIAEIQDTTEGTVKSRLNYSRKAIKNKVGEYEKKTGTKLHSVALLPLLIRFIFGIEKEKTKVPPIPAGLAGGTSAAGTSAGAGGASTGAVLAAKIAAGAVAAVLVISGAAFGISRMVRKNAETDHDDETLVPPTAAQSNRTEEPSATPGTETNAVQTEEPSAAPTTETNVVQTEEPSTAPATETNTVPPEEPSAAPVKSSEGLKLELSADGTSYSVTGIGSCTDTEVVIPASYNGLPVTEIGEVAFRDCKDLTGISIPSSVTTIGRFAFRGCTGLTDITIPDSVTAIDDGVFYMCTGLTDITIPDNVTGIGERAFHNCFSLTSVTIPNSVATIGDFAFNGCDGLTSITIPNSVTSIGNYAFQECESLVSIVIPNSVTAIGEWAFNYCTGLTSITIPNSVTAIRDYVFSCCTRLTDIVYNGTKTEWENIEKGDDWDFQIPSYTVHCTNGDITK